MREKCVAGLRTAVTIKLVGTEIHKNDTAKGAPVQGCCWDVVSPGDAAPQRFCAKDAAEYDEWTTFIQEAIDGVVQAGRKKPTLGIMKSMRPSVGSQARHYEDWVLKTGPDGRTWNLRWAVLDPTCKALLYYENDQKKKVKGIVDLRGVELKVGMEGNPMRDVPAFSITGEIGGVPRGITFCTPSVEAMQNWYGALPTSADLVVRSSPSTCCAGSTPSTPAFRKQPSFWPQKG